MCPNCVLEVRSSFRLEMTKVEFLEFWTSSGILISGSKSNSESWSMSLVLNMNCVQNLGSIGRGLVGFDIGCGILKFQVLKVWIGE